MNIILMVVIGISIFKNLIDKRSEAKALKRLSDDFDEYQKNCLVINDNLNEEISKVENEFKSYSSFVSESISEAVNTFNSVVNLSSSIVETNLAMLQKISVVEDLLTAKDISIENEEMSDLISILKNDIQINNKYSEQLRKEMSKPYESFRGIETRSAGLRAKVMPPVNKINKQIINEKTVQIEPNSHDMEL